MPGIAGIINNGLNPGNRAELDSMVSCLLHEDFYKFGTFYQRIEAGLAVGWVFSSRLFLGLYAGMERSLRMSVWFSPVKIIPGSLVDRATSD